MRSSRVIALSKEREELDWEKYKNENEYLSTPRSSWRRQFLEFKDYENAVRRHHMKYDPTSGPLNYAVYQERMDLLRLIFESGKNWLHIVILWIKTFLTL